MYLVSFSFYTGKTPLSRDTPLFCVNIFGGFFVFVFTYLLPFSDKPRATAFHFLSIPEFCSYSWIKTADAFLSSVTFKSNISFDIISSSPVCCIVASLQPYLEFIQKNLFGDANWWEGKCQCHILILMGPVLSLWWSVLLASRSPGECHVFLLIKCLGVTAQHSITLHTAKPYKLCLNQVSQPWQHY